MPVLPDLFRRHLLRVHCGHNVEMDVYLRFPSIADNSLVLFAKRDPAKGPEIGLIGTTHQLGCPGNENSHIIFATLFDEKASQKSLLSTSVK